MVLIAVNVVTVAMQMGVILSPVTAAVLQAGQVKLVITFVNLGGVVVWGLEGVLESCFVWCCISKGTGPVTADF